MNAGVAMNAADAAGIPATGRTIKVGSTIVRGGKYRWAVLIDGVLQPPPEINVSDTWDGARDQGLAFAKLRIEADH